MSFNPPALVDNVITIIAGDTNTDILYDGVTILDSDHRQLIQNTPHSIQVIHITPIRYKSAPFTTFARISSWKTFQFYSLGYRFPEFTKSLRTNIEPTTQMRENSVYTEQIPWLTGKTHLFEILESIMVIMIINFDGFIIPLKYRFFINNAIGTEQLYEQDRGSYILASFVNRKYNVSEDFSHLQDSDTQKEFIYSNLEPFVKIGEDSEESTIDVSTFSFEYVKTRETIRIDPKKISNTSEKSLARFMASENLKGKRLSEQAHEYIYDTIPFVIENMRPPQNSGDYVTTVSSSQYHSHNFVSKAFKLREGEQKVATAKDHRHSFSITNDDIVELLAGNQVTILTNFAKTATIPSHSHSVTIQKI